MDFTPDLNMEDVKSILSQHKLQFVVIFCVKFPFYVYLDVGMFF